MIEHVVGDMDGTLIDSAVVVPAAFVRTVAALDGPHEHDSPLEG